METFPTVIRNVLFSFFSSPSTLRWLHYSVANKIKSSIWMAKKWSDINRQYYYTYTHTHTQGSECRKLKFEFQILFPSPILWFIHFTLNPQAEYDDGSQWKFSANLLCDTNRSIHGLRIFRISSIFHGIRKVLN